MDLTGQTLGPYRIIEKIGSGGMADVYKAHQKKLDRSVAIKVLPTVLGRDEIFRARFVQEAKAVAQLYHPYIRKVFDYGEQDGITYIVMEYTPNGTLQGLMGQPLPLREAVEIISRIGEALAYAHQRGVIHRDVKPSNVLLSEGNWPPLSDFGLAKMVEGNKKLTRSGVSVGTPEYMSPEQGQGSSVDHRSDIYSLGVILYEMVTGQAPFEAETPMAVILKHMNEPLPSPRVFRPDLPVGIEAVIIKAMAKAPEDRYANAVEMVTALKCALEQDAMGLDHVPEEIQPLPDSMVERLKTPVPQRRFTLRTVWLTLALLFAGLALAWALVPGFAALLPFGTASTATPTRTPPATPTPTPVPAVTSTPVPAEPTLPAPTSTPTALPTATRTSTPTDVPTSAATPTSTAAQARTPTPTLPPAHTATPSPTPLPEAVADVASGLFRGPHSGTETLDIIAEGESVSILGRVDETQYGRWLHICNREGTEGFIYEPRFTCTVNWESLPLIEVPEIVIVATPRTSSLVVTPGTLDIVYIWPAVECNAGGGWTAYFTVKIAGGDGKNYVLYWDDQRVPFTVKEEERDVAVIQRPGIHGTLVGTVWVESGGQRVGKATSISKPSKCQ